MHIDLDKLQQHVDSRFDRLEVKLDEFSERTTKNTRDISWITGSVKFTVPLIITIILGLVAVWFK